MEFTTMSEIIEHSIILFNEYLQAENYDYNDRLDSIAEFLNGNKSQELEKVFFLNISEQLDKIKKSGIDKKMIRDMAILSISATCYINLFYYKINDMTFKDFPYDVLDFLENVKSYRNVLTQFYNNADFARTVVHEYLSKVEENNYYVRYVEKTLMDSGKLPNILKIDPFQIVEYAEVLELNYDDEIKAIIRIIDIYQKEIASLKRKAMNECDDINFIEEIINENLIGCIDNDFEYEIATNNDLEDYQPMDDSDYYDDSSVGLLDDEENEEIEEIRRQAEEECDVAEVMITEGMPEIFYKIANREACNDKTICYILKGAYSQLLLESKNYDEQEILTIEEKTTDELLELFKTKKEFAIEMVQKFIVYYSSGGEIVPEEFKHEEVTKVYQKLKVN